MRKTLPSICTVSSILALSVALTPVAVKAQAAPVADYDHQRHFSIPSGPLASALTAWSHKSGRSVLFRSEDLANARTNGASGDMTDDRALVLLLARSGFSAVTATDGSIAIVPDRDRLSDNGGNATPEILVNGKQAWTLNTGVERTQDDSQPFIVMTRDEIQRSGAPNLETFLRDRLNVNASPLVSEQSPAQSLTSSSSVGRGTSSFNLRGLGVRDTLILVDGRRQPGVNLGDGTIGQAQITGIPLAAIERIEVLASSASGIYGSGASGGVINIILKRDFSGGEITGTYGNTTDFVQQRAQIDLTYGAPLEGGRTRLSVTGSWRKSNPLMFGDRVSLREKAYAEIMHNNPDALNSILGDPLNAVNVNYRSVTGAPLRLKAIYGGTTLSSNLGTIPVGYAGLSVDGLQALLANVGKLDFQAPDTVTPGGLRYPALYGSETLNGSVTLRREFNSSLSGYIALTGSRSDSSTLAPRGQSVFTLSSSNPNNPFAQAIQVTLPTSGDVQTVRSRQEAGSIIAGAIVKLPANWQMLFDVSFSRSRFQSDVLASRATNATIAGIQSGEQNVLRDLNLYPIKFEYDSQPFSNASTPGYSTVFNPSVRVAGPLPFRLPGGNPQLTVNTEYSWEKLDGVVSASSSSGLVTRTFHPEATQTTLSAYGEIALPVIGRDNHVPLVRELEIRLSARAEHYRGDGADPVVCPSTTETLTLQNFAVGCPSSTAAISRAVTRNSRIDPSISFRWVPASMIAFRGSYTTGYLPPTLAQLVRISTETLYTSARDPQRGNELIGVPVFANYGMLSGYGGGNPSVKPESSKTLTGGFIVTPPFLPGLRFSADWTRIRKHNVYFDPSVLALGGTAAQTAFELFLKANPDRVMRAAASDGYAVGKITSLDLSLVNLLGVSTDAIDFVLDYTHPLLGGTLNVVSRATYTQSLLVESFPGAPAIEYAGVVSSGFAVGSASNGSLRFRGNLSATWTKDALTLGWQLRYFGRYALNVERTVDVNQGSAYVSAQAYNDVSVAYRFNKGLMLTLNVNNALNKSPPLDVSASPYFYSPYGDVRMRNFTLTVAKSF